MHPRSSREIVRKLLGAAGSTSCGSARMKVSATRRRERRQIRRQPGRHRGGRGGSPPSAVSGEVLVSAGGCWSPRDGSNVRRPGSRPGLSPGRYGEVAGAARRRGADVVRPRPSSEPAPGETTTSGGPPRQGTTTAHTALAQWSQAEQVSPSTWRLNRLPAGGGVVRSGRRVRGSCLHAHPMDPVVNSPKGAAEAAFHRCCRPG